jgi:hypothetical protein
VGLAMSKSKHRHRQQPIPNRQTLIPPMPPATPKATLQVDLGYNPSGPSEPVDITSSKEGWSEFLLEDGTVIRTKAVLLEAKKMTGQFNAAGEPIYALQIIMAQQARVPDNLKKKG